MLGSLLFCVALATTAVGDDPASSAAARPTDRTAYEAARKAAGPDAQAQVRLALWCEQHGMTAERMKHLAAAVVARPLERAGAGADGAGRPRRQVGAARRGQPRGPGRPQAEGPAGGISPAPGQGGGQGRRPVEAGPVVRAERAEGAGRRALPRGGAAGPEARRGVEAPGVQEGQRALDQAGVAGGGEARGRRAGPGQQALEADAGEVARGAIQPGQGAAGGSGGGAGGRDRPAGRADDLGGLRGAGSRGAEGRPAGAAPDRRRRFDRGRSP